MAKKANKAEIVNKTEDEDLAWLDDLQSDPSQQTVVVEVKKKKNDEVKGRLGIVSLRNLRTAWQDSFGEEESVRDQAFAEFDNAFRNMWHRNQRNEFNDQDTAELELCHQLWEAEYDRQEQAVDENRNEKGTKSCCQTNTCAKKEGTE